MSTANFDLIARAYRWLEYLSFGPSLQRTRTYFLPQLRGRRRAVLLGDGDGRFLRCLLRQNPTLQAEAVDSSATMLRLLKARARAGTRLRLHHQCALTYRPTIPPDLLVTHFFLDCLLQAEVESLAERLAPAMAPGALWLVSDFCIPSGVLRFPAHLYVRLLYGVFRLLTGLRTTRLPDHASALSRVGLVRIEHRYRLFGLLTTELWQKADRATVPFAAAVAETCCADVAGFAE